MRPETEMELLEREELQSRCKHIWRTIEMPWSWKRLSGALTCGVCGYDIAITIERVKE